MDSSLNVARRSRKPSLSSNPFSSSRSTMPSSRRLLVCAQVSCLSFDSILPIYFQNYPDAAKLG